MNYLEKANDLIAELEKEGRMSLVHHLKDAIKQGATGLEICVEIKYWLDQEPRKGLSPHTNRQLVDLLDFIDDKLK